MNLRKLYLISFIVLVVCQLGFAQIAALVPDRTLASKAVAAAQASGRPVPVVPYATIAARPAARPTIWLAKELPNSSGVLPAGEPSYCEGPYGAYFIYCPKGVTTAYGTNQIVGANGGAGMVIAIVDAFAYPYAEANLAVFNARMGLPACTTANGCFTSINLSPSDGSGSGWDLESMLDLEYAHAMAPNAKIVYVQAYDNSDDNLGKGVDIGARGCPGSAYCSMYGIASSPAADVVSNSWSGGEYSPDDFYWNIPKPLLFASGDYASWPLQGFVGYPCSANTVTCVGGTSLYVNASLQRTSETGWADSGGGCSQQHFIPTWQGRNGSGVCSPNRAAPDIAAIADPYTGVAVYLSNPVVGTHTYIVGGTSVATPVLAGVIANIDTARVSFGKSKLGFLNPGLYNAAFGNYNYFYYDVTSGNNGYPAGFQFDLVTGLGVPVGKDLANRFFGLP